jgi:phosphoserine phosphatase
MTKKEAALLDWDKTLYDGFTLLSWANFLSTRGEFVKYDYHQLEKLFFSFENGHLNYEELGSVTYSV